MKCDVLVVGASSAGLTAATAAAMGGASVILLDKDLDGFHHVANTLFEGMAAHSGIMVSDCYLEKELQGMRIISPGGAAVTIAAKGYFIDRQRFDEYYIRLAQSCGVALMSGTACSAKLDGNRRIVTLAEDQINARVVVDASGVDSTMARQAGMEPMLHPEDIAWAIEADVEHQFIGEEMFFQYWIGSMAPGWKATFSPAGENHATLGVFVRGRGQNVLPFFHEFLKRFKAYKKAQYKDIEDLKILSMRQGWRSNLRITRANCSRFLSSHRRRSWPKRFGIQHACRNDRRNGCGRCCGQWRCISQSSVQIRNAVE